MDASAHFPSHALAIHLHASVRSGITTTLAGDIIASHLVSEDVRSKLNAIQGFSYEEWDAMDLPIKTGSAHVVFDRKGALWHAAEQEDTGKILAILQSFSRVLGEYGCIVVDDIPPLPDGIQSESSTITKIQKISLLGGREIMAQIQRDFEVLTVGERQTRVMVFQKK